MNCVHEYRSTLCYGQLFIYKIVLWFYSLDEILGRGLYSGEITEIFGLSGVGKSQVANLKSLFMMENKFKKSCHTK